MNALRTWIEIDPDHFAHNITQYKGIIGPINRLCLVIKANAYGHGLPQIAQMAESNPQVDLFCVATIQEALEIRKMGARKPIIIASVLDGDPQEIIGKNVALAVYDLHSAQYLEQLGARYGTVFPVHIKIDTGLSRLGVAPHEALAFVQTLQKMAHISIEGIYSHCAESHKQDDSFTREQQALFQRTVQELGSNGLQMPLVHFANSAATTSLDLPFCNLFRIGIGAFGLWPGPENKLITLQKYPGFDLKPILTWKTIIRHIKQVPAGSFIGYDRTYQAAHYMRIALLPIGYSDGYDFRLFNRGSVIVHGQTAPIVGRISMNMCSIDISHLPQAAIDDEVILMGPQQAVHPYQLGLLAGNPNVREITTKINPNIARILSKSSDHAHALKLLYEKSI